MDEYWWQKLSDQELLKVRIKDLRLDLESSDIRPWIQRVFDELRSRALLIRPRIYLGDEWFSPDGVPAVAIPFFLAHPRLRSLERKMMYECEGEVETDFLKLVRHEMGHAFDHCFKISRRTRWQRIFGSNKVPYHPEAYRPRPYSKGFVQNISDQYAQAHPDEDFAETFAVWLDPQSNWKEKYRKWGAIKKLEYVNQLGREFAGVETSPPRGRLISDAAHLSSTLEFYYQKKKRQLEEESPDFYDADLQKIFSKFEQRPKNGMIKASTLLRSNRKMMIQNLALFTKERKVIINQILSELIDRCSEIKLYVVKSPDQSLLEFTAFMANLITVYRMTGRFKQIGVR